MGKMYSNLGPRPGWERLPSGRAWLPDDKTLPAKTRPVSKRAPRQSVAYLDGKKRPRQVLETSSVEEDGQEYGLWQARCVREKEEDL